MTALLPLLPLLQAVPLHIDSVKDKIFEKISNTRVITTSRDLEDLVGSVSLSPPAAPSERTFLKRKRSRATLDEDGSDVETIRPTNRIRVHEDNNSAVPTTSSSHISLIPALATLVDDSVRRNKKDSVRKPLPDSAAPFRSTSNLQSKGNPRTSFRNQIASSNRPYGFLSSSSKDSNAQPPRRPLADLFGSRHPGSVTASPEDPPGFVSQPLNPVNRSRSAYNNATPSVNPSIARKVSHTNSAVSSHKNLAAPPTEAQVQIPVDSMTDSATNSEEPFSENILSVISAFPQYPLSIPASGSTNGSSGSSTDRTLTSDSPSMPALVPAPVAIPIMPDPPASIAPAQEDGLFLVPMIRPMVMQRSWTSAVSCPFNCHD